MHLQHHRPWLAGGQGRPCAGCGRHCGPSAPAAQWLQFQGRLRPACPYPHPPVACMRTCVRA
eukprot:1138409-Pelagomonas_calceolata.AAC.2